MERHRAATIHHVSPGRRRAYIFGRYARGCRQGRSRGSGGSGYLFSVHGTSDVAYDVLPAAIAQLDETAFETQAGRCRHSTLEDIPENWGFQLTSVARFPGLKRETWATLFPGLTIPNFTSVISKLQQGHHRAGSFDQHLRGRSRRHM